MNGRDNTIAYASHVGLHNLTFVWTAAEIKQFIRWCAHERSKRKRATRPTTRTTEVEP
jgi:hypothetical protein